MLACLALIISLVLYFHVLLHGVCNQLSESCCNGTNIWLQVNYKASKKRFDEDHEFKERARKAVTKLQGGDAEFIKAWGRICEASRKVRLLSRDESFIIASMGWCLETIFNILMMVFVWYGMDIETTGLHHHIQRMRSLRVWSDTTRLLHDMNAALALPPLLALH